MRLIDISKWQKFGISKFKAEPIIIRTGNFDRTLEECKDVCPECGSESLIMEARCVTCTECFWSRCSI